jgi:hypothetical protein
MAAATIETIQKVQFYLLPHSACSPVRAPSDYHIFRMLEDELHGHTFSNGEVVRDTVHT